MTPKSQDPVALLQESGRRFVPVNTAWNGGVSDDPPEVPSSEDRSSATDIIEEMQKQSWYKDQICFRQGTESKAVTPGLGLAVRSPPPVPHT